MPLSKEQEIYLILLGARVKKLRVQRNLTLKNLAHGIGKDPQSIHRLEKGRINPSFLYLLEISKGLDIDVSKLVDISILSKE